MSAFTVSDNGGGGFTPAPVGTHRAVCTQVIDLGTQHSTYEGKESVRRQVFLSFELPDELMDDGRPYSVGAFFTASLNEKATLRHQLASWRGRDFTDEELKGFNMFVLLGKPAMVSVIEKNGKSRIGSISKLPKGMEAPEPIGPLMKFSLQEFNQAEFDAVSKGLQKIIMQSDEMTGKTANPHNPKSAQRTMGNGPEDMDDDIPF